MIDPRVGERWEYRAYEDHECYDLDETEPLASVTPLEVCWIDPETETHEFVMRKNLTCRVQASDGAPLAHPAYEYCPSGVPLPQWAADESHEVWLGKWQRASLDSSSVGQTACSTRRRKRSGTVRCNWWDGLDIPELQFTISGAVKQIPAWMDQERMLTVYRAVLAAYDAAHGQKCHKCGKVMTKTPCCINCGRIPIAESDFRKQDVLQAELINVPRHCKKCEQRIGRSGVCCRPIGHNGDCVARVSGSLDFDCDNRPSTPEQGQDDKSCVECGRWDVNVKYMNGTYMCDLCREGSTEHDLIDMVDDQPVTRMPEFCVKNRCGGPRLVMGEGGHVICPVCLADYGRVTSPLGIDDPPATPHAHTDEEIETVFD